MATSLLRIYTRVLSNNSYKICNYFSKNFRAAHHGARSQFSNPRHEESSDSSSSSSDEEARHNREDVEEESLKAEILDASLPFVNSLGWSREAIAKGAESLGYPGVAHGLFTRGAIELVNHFCVSCNDELEGHLHDVCGGPEQKSRPASEDVVREGIRVRLNMIVPYLDKWTQAMSIMMYPRNIPSSLKIQLELANTILFYAGDTSVNMDWYGKRIALLAVYSTTELCLIQDKSPNRAATWEFLERRVRQMHAASDTIDRAQNSRQVAKDLVGGGLITVRNMLGLR